MGKRPNLNRSLLKLQKMKGKMMTQRHRKGAAFQMPRGTPQNKPDANVICSNPSPLLSMAGAAIPSHPSLLLKSRYSALSFQSSYLKSQKDSHLLLLPPVTTALTTSPRIIYPHSNLRGRLEEVAEEIEEAYTSGDDAQIDDDDSDYDEESSINLLFRFLQSMFRKASRRAKKATRVVLPPVIPTHLVSFAVDGLLLLTALSVAKALLEVICNLGATVFAVIVLLRLVWAVLSHFQSGGNSFSGGSGTYTMPAT